MVKRIGVLTAGGDCAGLNAALRGVTYRAILGYGWEVFGIHQGTEGLLSRPLSYKKLECADFWGGVMNRGGTVLRTTIRGNPTKYPMPDGSFCDKTEEFIEGYRLLGLDALIGIAGDGGLGIIHSLTQRGKLNFVGIPKTIDNDVGFTEASIGFNTAVEVATEALDRLQPTAASHDRVMILEVMGRDAGHIALSAGIAGGADIILIPEIPYTLQGIAEKINSLKATGHNFALIVVAEAVKTQSGEKITIADAEGKTRYGGISHYLAQSISEMTGAETRFMVLGHVQRGGQPMALDRILATAFGTAAVDLVAKGAFDRVVTWQGRRVVDLPIAQVLENYHVVDPKGTLVQSARGLGIYVGDVDTL